MDHLLPKPGKKIKDGIQHAQLILITSQEIDELGEADNMAQARLQIDGVLSHLRRGRWPSLCRWQWITGHAGRWCRWKTIGTSSTYRVTSWSKSIPFSFRTR